MIIGRSSTKFLFFYADRKFKMAATAGHRLTLEPMGKCSNAFFSETTNMIKAKLYMNVHWMILYKLHVFWDIQLEGNWTQTFAHEQFLFADDGNSYKIIMFTKTLPTLYQKTSSIETALSTLHQLNLLCSTYYTQWSTISYTHSSLDYYPVKVEIHKTVTSTYARPLVNNINFS